MADDQEDLISPCPVCFGKRVDARLKTPGVGNNIYICEHGEDCDDFQPVHAWWCKKCGHIELYAVSVPRKLGRTTYRNDSNP